MRRDPWPTRGADLLHRDVTREDLIAIGCITPRPRLQRAIEANASIEDHPDAAWKGAGEQDRNLS